MAKNVIIMIGDGMGWEMARAAAIQARINLEESGSTLNDFYTEGKGEGLSFQNLTEYTLATTYSTVIDNSKDNSALEGNPLTRPTGDAPVREEFEFNPDINAEEGREGNLAGYDPVRGRTLPWDEAYYGGEAPDGFDPDYIKQAYADSANTATTLYTGQKTYTGAIGVDIFEEAAITLAEVALKAGKSAGVVTSVPLNHATPGAAIAHISHRNKYHDESVKDANGDSILPEDDNIFWDIINEVQPTVVLGGGHPDGPGSTYINPDNLAQLRNGETVYTFLERGENAGQTLLAKAAELDPDQGDKLFGLYGARGQGGNLPWSTADGDYSNTGLSGRTDTNRPLDEGETVEAFIAKETNENPTLAQLTSASLDVLGSDDQGFWLMVEQGDIDWAAHDNNIDNQIGTTLDFSDSVQVVVDWIGQNGGWGENLLIVTADHDHYLTLNENFPQLLREQGAEALTAAENPADAGHFWGSDPTVKYGWGTHTNRPVPVYFQGDGEAFLNSLVGEGYEAYGTQVSGIPELVDQVHVHAAMTASLVNDIVIDGKTEANPYVFDLEDVDPATGKDPNYNIIPLLTVGDQVPLLEGEFGNFTPSQTETYGMAGIPDGLGFTQIGDYYYVFMNHELGSGVTTDIGATSNAQINGARVSLYVFDQDWHAIGGKNLIENVLIDDVTYAWHKETGNYETADGNILNLTDHNNFDRFCSGYLAATGFVDENGNEIPIYFAPEEVDGGTAIPILPDGTAIPLRGLGTFSKEQVFAASQYRATNSDYTALLSMEDEGDGEIYLYVGQQTTANPNGLTSNPDEFNLYVLKVVDPTTGEVFSYEAMPENVALISQWQLIPNDIALNTDPTVLSDWVNATDGEIFRSTNFRRPEDLHEDPSNPGMFYAVTTGTNEIPPDATAPDNIFGMLHRFSLALDENGVPLDGMFEFLMEGGLTTGVSYDNMVVDSNGNVLIQEDRTAGGGNVMDTQMRNGRVLSYNIAYNANRIGNDEITFLFEIDQTAAGEQFDTSFGAWESSGIIEVLGGTEGLSAYLFDVQAGTIRNDSGVYEGRYERGGQLLLAIPQAESTPTVKLVDFSSLPADTFASGLPGGSGNALNNPTNGRETPFNGQPVQGFSGVQFAENGNYWFLSDNGYGSKANSADYLLRIYEVDPNFDTGEAQWTSFIQLSDPNNLIPFEIVQEGTTERLLTGADFDVESIVVAPNGDIWLGEEFGPYLLHFNSEGELLSAPIATPNNIALNTVNGQDPLVIGHRGASGLRPEHTLEAYQLAIEQGADFIEPDLVATKDGVLIARHENALATVKLDADGQIERDANGDPIITSETTNVADIAKFSDRLTVKSIDGDLIGGWFSEDFTLSEIKELRARERIPNVRPDNTAFNDQFEIPTLSEVINLVKQVEATTGKQIGIYPETKHPTYFQDEGTRIDGTKINVNLGATLVSTLLANGFTDPDRIFIQSFEVANLIQLQDVIFPAFDAFFSANLSKIPLVQLYGDTDDTSFNAVGGGFSVPYDIVYNFSQAGFDPSIYGGLVDIVPDFGQDVTGDGIPDTTYKDLATAEVFAYLGANYAEGIGPWKNSFILRESISPPVDGNGDGVAQISSQLTGEIRPYIDWAHDAGLQVHPYTFRQEESFLTLNPDGTPQTLQQEFEQLINLGIDGFFTDFPGIGRLVVDQLTQNFVASPDNPDVLAGNAVANLSRSRGFEGMAYSPDYSTLYPLLEGSVAGDPDNALRIYKFDVASASYAEDLVGFYGLDNPSYAIGDFTPINDTEFLVIERDNNQGASAQFKKIFKVDFSNLDANGYVEKVELVDLLNIADPDDLNGDGSKVFTFPFVTIEDVLVLDEKTLLVANDNNYPFSIGRGTDIDNNEIIKIELPVSLNLVPELGLTQVSLSASPAIVAEGSQLTWDFTLTKAVPTGGLVINLDLTEDTDPLPGDIQYNVTGSENIADFELVTVNGVIQGANITLTEGATMAKLVSNIIADMKTEGTESIAFTLATGENYRINPDSNQASFTIEDTSQTPIPRTVSGTAGDDTFDAVFPDEKGFIGEKQILLTGSGDDTVDVTEAVGGNTLRTASGDDTIYAGTNNRIIAGNGDDLLFLGSGGGNNRVTGGFGADIFFLTEDDTFMLAQPNMISDFKASQGDLIGFLATDLTFDSLGSDWSYRQSGAHTIIEAFGQDVAILKGISATSLTEDNFVFA